MEIDIRLAKEKDLSQYTELLQKTYQEAYINEDIGLTKSCFSKEIFSSQDTQKYLASNLKINDKQKCWVAFSGSKMVGTITITERKDDYELRGFYVSKEFQGQGIGKKLWNLVLDFAKGKDITCDIYAHNAKTIEMYIKWGFEIDKERGNFYRHWPEWPKDVRAECIYMRYKLS